MKTKPTHESPATNHPAYMDTVVERNILLRKWQFVAASTVVSILLLAASGRAEEAPAIVANKKKLIEQCIKQMTEDEADGAGKAMAFHMLQKLGPDAVPAVPALSEALKHKDSYVRIQSAYTLWTIDQRASAIQILSTELNEKTNKAGDRAMAANFLGQVGADAKAVLPTLAEAAKDQDAQIQVNAARALWAVDKRSDLAEPVLIAGLKQSDLNVFASAAQALGEIGFNKSSLIALNEAIRIEPQNGSRAHAVASVIPALAKALGSNDVEIRKEAIAVMGLMSNTMLMLSRKSEVRAAIQGITKALHDEDPEVAAKAAEVLKKIGQQAEEVPHGDKIKKMPPTDTSDAETVVKAFIIALANKNVQEAAQYIIPEERDDMTKELEKGVPPLPRNPEVEIHLKENGSQADVTIVNAEKAKSGRPVGLDMKLSNGKWWVVK